MNIPKPTSDRWPAWFIFRAATKLEEFVSWSGRVLPDERSPERAEQYIGFPAVSWAKTLKTYRSSIKGPWQWNYLFAAGLAIGWLLARRKYDKDWKA